MQLNVATDPFASVIHKEDVNGQAIFRGLPTPDNCRSCPEETTCGGGYLPHRYSNARGFNNPSVWCADLLKLFQHIRQHLGVTVSETSLRREVLVEMAREARGERA